MRRDVSDLIEEECASVCLLELSDVISVCVSECPLYVAEQLALEKSLRTALLDL